MEEGDQVAKRAHRIAGERAVTPRRFLNGLARGTYLEIDLSTLPAKPREQMLGRLRKMQQEAQGITYLLAAQALLELGDPLGSEAIVDCLSGNDPYLRRAALDRLNWFRCDRTNGGFQVPLNLDAVLVALELSIADPHAWTRQRALRVLDRMQTPGALDRLAELVRDADPFLRREAAILLGRSGEDRGALAVIDEMLPLLGQHFDRYHFIAALEKLCENPDARTSARAGASARRFVLANLENPSIELANDLGRCLAGIAAAGLVDELEILSKVLASVTHSMVRATALKRLARLEGSNGITRLLGALSDPDLREAAIEGLVSHPCGANEPRVLDFLAQEIARDDAKNVTALVKAFLALGGKGSMLSERAATQVDPETAMTIHWLQAGIRPAEAAARLRGACMGPPPSAEQLVELEAEWDENPNASSVIYALLGQYGECMTGFECKTIYSPADHAELVVDLAAITGGRFALDDVVQTVGADSDDEIHVLFVHRGIGYSFRVQHCGRYYDLEGVLAGVNGILERLGYAEKFFQLYTGSVVVVVMFLVAAEFMTAATDLRIPLEFDPDSAQAVDAAYVHQVLSRLSDQDT